jgi:DNA polymerase III delta prime subunit
MYGDVKTPGNNIKGRMYLCVPIQSKKCILYIKKGFIKSKISVDYDVETVSPCVACLKMTEKIQLAKKGTHEMTVFRVMSKARPVLRGRG